MSNIVKVEHVGGVAFILDANGNVWQFNTDWDGRPEIRRVTTLDRDAVNRITEPQLARFAR